MSKVEKLNTETDFREEDNLFQPSVHTVSEQEEKIATDYRNGLGIKDLTAKYDVAVGTVYNALRRQEVTLRKGMYNSRAGNRLLTMTTLEKDSLVEDYLSGMTMKAIYTKHRINKHGCYTILDERNIARRGSSNFVPTKTISVEEADKQLSMILESLDTVKSPVTSVDAKIEGETLQVRVFTTSKQPITQVVTTIEYEEEV